MESGKDLLAAYPRMTCAVGFVGGLQLWLTPSAPHMVILSTGCGSLLWDLSTIDLDTEELVTIQRNPADSFLGCALLALLWLLHSMTRVLVSLLHIVSGGFLQVAPNTLVPPPALPLQYFVEEQTGEAIGRAEMEVSWGIALRFTFFVKNPSGAGGRWKQMGPSISFKELNMQLVGSGGAAGTMRMDSLGGQGESVAIHTCSIGDTTAYVEYPSGKVLASHPLVDLDGFVTDPHTGCVIAALVSTTQTDMLPLSPAGERFKQRVLRVSSALCLSADKGESLSVTSRTSLDDVWVLYSSSDAEAGAYYLLHNPYKDSVPRHLLSARPLLRPYKLAFSEAVDIPTRDGELLPSFLSMPSRQSHASPSPVPLALLLHGGPSARDHTGYDPVVQLLVSRGVAVLKVNYRGSTGYGRRYLKLGSGNLQGMHNDIEDARQWAIAANIADETRIAVIGASWGGYLALGAATGLYEKCDKCASHTVDDESTQRHPYAAVVAIVPVVTVGAVNTSKAFRGDPIVAHYWRDICGEAVSTSREAAEALSPLFHLPKLVGTRLWLVHGEDDVRVPREHGDMVAAKTKSLGIPGGHVTYAKEGHHIRKEPNVLHMWNDIYQFLESSLAMSVDTTHSVGPINCFEGHTATVHYINL